MIARWQPTTVYQIRKMLNESPTTSFSTSPGKMYPIIERLRTRGLIEAERVEGDGRKTERLRVTKDGKAAVKAWVKAIRPVYLLPEDPLRTHAGFADMLSKAERARWRAELLVALKAKLVEIERFAEEWPIPAMKHAHAHAQAVTRTRIAWVEAMIAADD
ncbi:PadR family transcriptional regulator [Sphingoaurantiacus capsulatus]|uniref:PadR family transcriptional regulator n=1 Tax=Sphingoaurantiacus capsulatus TaxID=1771310 RepID=A0ABV7X7Y5_9SPHN